MLSFRKLVKKIFSSKRSIQIDPDEIFLDSSNLPQFDTSQFEGRIEKAIPKRSLVYLGIFFLLVVILFTNKMYTLQVKEGKSYVARSENNRLHHSYIFAERGVIYDRNGIELAWNEPHEDEEFASRRYISLGGFGHLLGYTQAPRKDSSGKYFQTEEVGLTGVEESFNDVIQGVNGLKIIETDAVGETKSESVVSAQIDGDNITLSIDSGLQNALYGYIEELSKKVSFVGGAGVIMDVNNGEILAITSYPEYSPTRLSEGDDISDYITDSRKPFLNRAVSGLYTPGSIVKPFVALGALNEGVIDPNTSILSTGSIRIQNPYYPDIYSVFPDWKAHGYVDMREALAVSSNVYFYEIGGGYEDQKGIGIKNIEKYVRMFGIGSISKIELDGEKEGIIPNPEWKEEMFEDGEWRIGDTYHTAIGQYGFQVTPVQMVRAISAIASGGELYTPTLLYGEDRGGKNVSISPKDIKVVQEGMRRAVTDGTAKGLDVSYVDIAAKTGTAQLGAKNEFHNSWAIGYFPYEDPKYAFTVIMERGPAKNTLGGVYVMRGLLDWMNQNKTEYFE